MIDRFPLTILVVIAIGIHALVLSRHGWVIPASFFSPLSAVVSALAVFLLVFDKWVWAWPLVRLVAKRPDLRGTWKAELRSSWRDPDTKAPEKPILAYVVVRQTASSVHVRLMTQDSRSISVAASLLPEADGAYVLSSIYRNEPRLSKRRESPIHHGGLVLRLSGAPAQRMSGHYWTDRKSDGEIDLKRLSREAVDDFEAARALKS